MPKRPNKSACDPTDNGLFSEAEWDRLVTHLSISKRQAEILHLLLNGECDKEIAEKTWHLSLNTSHLPL